MFLFSISGLVFIILNTKDLFTAVAVSGTAATFLTTTFIFKIILDVTVSKASLLFSFFLSVSGSVLYYLESQGLNNFFSNYFLLSHKYYTLLFINTAILFLSSCSVFILKKK